METMTMVRGAETTDIAPCDECFFLAAGWIRKATAEAAAAQEEPVKEEAPVIAPKLPVSAQVTEVK